MARTTDHKSRLRFRRWLFGTAILALLFTAALLMTGPLQNSHFSHDPRFVATALSDIGLPSNATLTCISHRMFCRMPNSRIFSELPIIWTGGKCPDADESA